jgi:hypothetical protein
MLARTCLSLALTLVVAVGGQAANHRAAPLTALDHKADITDFFAFVSYDDPGKSPNFRALPNGTGIAGVLTAQQDADDTHNFASDDVAGFNINAIAIEVPVTLLTRDGKPHAASEPLATIDVAYQETFSYLGWAHSGRDSRHVDPGEAGCATDKCPVE